MAIARVPGALHSEKALISLVVPFFNESAGVSEFFRQVIPVLQSIQNVDYEIICVNDGSRDDTLDRLIEHAIDNPALLVIDLSRNFGKEAAASAGLAEARGDAVIPFDADLQDPPEVIPRLVEKWRDDGFEVVLAKRADRAVDSALKRRTAAAFYKLHNLISDLAIPADVGDFRLMSRHVADVVRSLPENRRFMKGLYAWAGFRSVTVEYRRTPRSSGRSKFSYWRLWNLALEGITSFSTLPLRVWSYIGGITAALALLHASYLLARTIIHGRDVPGYASIITAVLLLGGIQLIGIGTIGEYVGRIYMEAKRRPVYVVQARYGQRVSR